VVEKATFYGVVALLLALSLITSSLAMIYYFQDQQQTSETQRYVAELDSALERYASLSSSYASALDGYNSTIWLLSDALSNLNTSTLAYQQGSRALASLWLNYLNLTKGEKGRISYSVDILIAFGNGTRRWHNGTAVQPGWNAYVATLVVAGGDVKATWYPSYGEHLVTGIEGVVNNPSEDEGWFLWTLNPTGGWKTASVGADQIPMFNGTTLAWTYCSFDPNTYAPLCSP
jgi:hypothetical protein